MGILRYFDKVLPVMLLYKNERQQYKEAISNDVRPSTIYGAEHLLRLFGRTLLVYLHNITDVACYETSHMIDP